MTDLYVVHKWQEYGPLISHVKKEGEEGSDKVLKLLDKSYEVKFSSKGGEGVQSPKSCPCGF